jgi:secondary thiamine-phosphate synthase enzyme
MVVQESLTYRTQGRGSIELTEDVARIVSRCGVRQGLCHVFVHHTSASHPTVLRDLEAFMARLVPDGDPLFRHTAEGPDDMPAHVRSVLTQSALTIPVSEGHCLLV